jgi:hypothetical protein
MKTDTSKWDEFTISVINQMTPYLQHKVTPVTEETKDEHGSFIMLRGSGTYIEYRERIFLLTNEHVAKVIGVVPTYHQLYKCDSPLRITNHAAVMPSPIDVAIIEIDREVWEGQHCAEAVKQSSFASCHQPVDGELLFTLGYSGQRSGFHLECLSSGATPYLTQQTVLPKEYGSNEFHFALHYNPDRAFSIIETRRSQPTPPGLSGSLVWNTRAVEFERCGRKWSPNYSEVTGIVWGWPSKFACLLATKVEYICINALTEKITQQTNNKIMVY